MKPKALVLPCHKQLVQVCDENTLALINERFDATYIQSENDITEQEEREIIGGYDIVLTSWGSPVIGAETLAAAKNLKYIGHAAGSVKNRVPFEAFGRGVRVFSAAPRIAYSVAEYCLAAIMTSLRFLPTFNTALSNNGWKISNLKGYELRGMKVGIVSLSSTARALIPLLKLFECEILAYDPYCSDEQFAKLGIKKASLEEAMSCRVVSIHAPLLPETKGMITADLLKLIPDGGLFVNSSRGNIIDQAALVAELKSGRFNAALDVFEKEPLPENHELRSLSNVLATPHVAGASVQGHLSLMGAVVCDIVAAIDGKETAYEVDPGKWDLLA